MAEPGGTQSCVGRKCALHCGIDYSTQCSPLHILANTSGHLDSPCMQTINLHKSSTGNKVLMLVNECCSGRLADLFNCRGVTVHGSVCITVLGSGFQYGLKMY